jgi:hypothetical protein
VEIAVYAAQKFIFGIMKPLILLEILITWFSINSEFSLYFSVCVDVYEKCRINVPCTV